MAVQHIHNKYGIAISQSRKLNIIARFTKFTYVCTFWNIVLLLLCISLGQTYSHLKMHCPHIALGENGACSIFGILGV